METAELRKLLHERVAQVTFKKVNGDIRIMDCTLNTEFIPPSQFPQGKIELTEETSVRTIRVFDVKAQGWRSFIVENILEVI